MTVLYYALALLVVIELFQGPLWPLSLVMLVGGVGFLIHKHGRNVE